ncbi:Glycine-rich domain-containing protein-like protein [Pleurotus pulmonarius]
MHTFDLQHQLQADVPPHLVRLHLRVLGAFEHLLVRISTRERALDEFLQRATYRLQLWVDGILETGDDSVHGMLQACELPPLDVALALHSLMLSPHRYFEDSQLRFPQLNRLKEFPLAMVVAVLRADNSGYDGRECQPAAERWKQVTGLEFEPTASMESDATRVVRCPSCDEAARVPWAGAQGFAGPDFVHACTKCEMPTTHDTLRAGKLFKALNKAKEAPGFCLPNTALLIRGELDVEMRCPAITNEVWSCFESGGGRLIPLHDVATMAAAEGRSIMAYVAETLSKPDSAIRPESIPALLRAFEHSFPFTQDVVDALHHQRRFIQDIYHRGWSKLGTGRPSDAELDEAYACYGEFLHLVTTAARREPAWKEDLIWHTHQLMPERYRANVVNYTGLFLDHLPRGEDINAYRPKYDGARNPVAVSIWVAHRGGIDRKGPGGDEPADPEHHQCGEECPASCPQNCSCGCCQAGGAAMSFLRTEPVSNILEGR